MIKNLWPLEWLENVGGTEKLPESSFKESDCFDRVNTRMVVINKPLEEITKPSKEATPTVESKYSEYSRKARASKRPRS